MIQVYVQDHEVVCGSMHAAGLLEIRLRVPTGWTTSQRLDLANILAKEIEEIRIGCTSSFTATGELVAWEDERVLVRLVRYRVAGRWMRNSPPPLMKDVQVLLEGKKDQFRFILESMIQVATDAPPHQIHRILFNDPPSPPSGWEATVRQRCCARFVKASDGKQLVVAMGLIHGPTDWMPFLQITRLDEMGISWGGTWLQGHPLGQFPERWLMEACELAPTLAQGFRRGEVRWDEGIPWLCFGSQTRFLSLRHLAMQIERNKGAGRNEGDH